jgi:hypothetical protein
VKRAAFVFVTGRRARYAAQVGAHRSSRVDQPVARRAVSAVTQSRRAKIAGRLRSMRCRALATSPRQPQRAYDEIDRPSLSVSTDAAGWPSAFAYVAG